MPTLDPTIIDKIVAEAKRLQDKLKLIDSAAVGRVLDGVPLGKMEHLRRNYFGAATSRLRKKRLEQEGLEAKKRLRRDQSAAMSAAIDDRRDHLLGDDDAYLRPEDFAHYRGSSTRRR